MPDDIQRLIVALEARTRGFENALNKANGVANKRATAIEKRFKRVNSNVSRDLTRLGAVFVSAAALKGAQNLIDASTRIENALKVAGLAGDELTAVYDRLFASAQRNAVPVETLVNLYSKMAQAQTELGVSQEEMISFTNTVAESLRVSGLSAEQASGALLQLGQALGEGVVRAQEYNSLLENGRPLLQAVAAGLEEAGGSVSKLTTLVKEGKVSSQAFFRAGQAGAGVLAEKLADAELTVSQRFVRLRNVLIDAAGDLDDASGASAALGLALDDLSTAIEGVDFSGIIGDVATFVEKVEGAITATNNWAKEFGKATGLSKIGEYVGGFDAGPLGGIRPAGGDRALAASIAGLDDHGGVTPLEPIVVTGNSRKPVSLADYPVTGGKSGGASGDPYGRSVESIQERTAALQAETAALQSLNPLVNDYGYAVEKAKAEHELLTAAQEAGVEITPALREQIGQLAEGYAIAQVEAAKLAEEQANLVEAFDEFKGLASDVIKGFVSDIRSGVEASEALVNALGKIQDKLIDMALDAAINSLFSNIAGLVGGGFGGGQFSIASGGGIGLYAKGGIHANGKPRKLMRTFSRGGISNEAAIFGEAGPEAAVPLPDGRTIPVTLKTPKVANSNRRSQSEMMVTLSPDLEARILQEAQDQSVQIVGRAAPSIVSAATGQTAKQFAAGGYDKTMAVRFGTKASVMRRG